MNNFTFEEILKMKHINYLIVAFYIMVLFIH